VNVLLSQLMKKICGGGGKNTLFFNRFWIHVNILLAIIITKFPKMLSVRCVV